MTVAETARRLEVSPALVYSLVASGKIGCYRIGHGRGSIRISEEHLASYLAGAERCRESPSPPSALVPKPPRLKHLRPPP